MSLSLAPKNMDESLSWSSYQPIFEELSTTDLNVANIEAWLTKWSKVEADIDDLGQRLYVLKTTNTADKLIEESYNRYLDDIFPNQQEHSQALKTQLLASGLCPSGFEIQIRNMKSEAALFRDENIPLRTEEYKMSLQYGEVVGNQTVEWDGDEVTLTKLDQNLYSQDRAIREKAWRAGMSRREQDRAVLNQLWTKLLHNRTTQATNAGYNGDYRAFRWEELQRFDYTPADCKQFHASIEKVVVPAMKRILDRRRASLGVDSLRPWDLLVDSSGKPALKPFANATEMTEKAQNIFNKLDTQLASYYSEMNELGYLDLDNRKNKAPGGYCTAFATTRKPFIYMNAVGSHRDVQTLIHEAGHAFHVFESAKLTYNHQLNVNTEFAEVASMSMELLAGKYLSTPGSYYNETDANRARVEHLEKCILFWPYMAVVDAFQHWVYENPSDAADASNCDSAWAGLWDRFMQGEDWSGLEREKTGGWHRKLHIFEVPLYYVEYGLAQLGAFQVWRNSLTDETKAVQSYRSALALGGTATLPELFAAAGAKFDFSEEILTQTVDLIEAKIEEFSN